VNEIWGNYRKIAGTKTVCDIDNGICADRFMAILEKYRKQLPLLKKLQVAVKRKYYYMMRLASDLRQRALFL